MTIENSELKPFKLHLTTDLVLYPACGKEVWLNILTKIV